MSEQESTSISRIDHAAAPVPHGTESFDLLYRVVRAHMFFFSSPTRCRNRQPFSSSAFFSAVPKGVNIKKLFSWPGSNLCLRGKKMGKKKMEIGKNDVEQGVGARFFPFFPLPECHVIYFPFSNNRLVGRGPTLVSVRLKFLL